MADATNLDAVYSAKAFYKREMEQVCGEDKPFLIDAVLRAEHGRCRAEAHIVFHVNSRGGPELAAPFVEDLNEYIEVAFENFELINDNKKQMADVTNWTALNSATAVYKREMEQICCGGDGDVPLDDAELFSGHERCRGEAMRAFDAKKMGGTELTAQFVEKLDKDIQATFHCLGLINIKKKKTETTNSLIIRIAKTVYKKEMEKICNGDKLFLSVAELRAGHERCRTEAQNFVDAKRVAGLELTTKFVEKLEADIQKAFITFERNNKRKRMLAMAALVLGMIIAGRLFHLHDA